MQTVMMVMMMILCGDNVNVGLIKTLRGGFDTTIEMFRSFFDLYQTKGLAVCKC